jgi:hypothetical protein
LHGATQARAAAKVEQMLQAGADGAVVSFANEAAMRDFALRDEAIQRGEEAGLAADDRAWLPTIGPGYIDEETLTALGA